MVFGPSLARVWRSRSKVKVTRDKKRYFSACMRFVFGKTSLASRCRWFYRATYMQRYSAAVYILWLIVCLSVCLSQAGVLSKRLIDRAGFRHRGYARLFCKRSRIPQKMRVLTWTLSQTVNFAHFPDFSPHRLDRRKCCQLSSTVVMVTTLNDRVCLQHVARDVERRITRVSLS